MRLAGAVQYLSSMLTLLINSRLSDTAFAPKSERLFQMFTVLFLLALGEMRVNPAFFHIHTVEMKKFLTGFVYPVI